ncbi:MAG: hypothetical protein HQK58_14355 [Deltaproteobacteria bacterium]|nr:hypothetical protein [Deltaproteobacteria bacterium]
MKTGSIITYLSGCVLLTIPIMIWNAILVDRLPKAYSDENFWKDIPPIIVYGENTFRILAFVLPVFMPLNIATPSQMTGLVIYLVGALAYFSAWAAQLFFPQSAWSTSLMGFLAPAYTPLLWLTGIGLIGDSFFFPAPYRSWVYITIAFLFVAFHCLHTWLVYLRTFPPIHGNLE